MKRYLLLSLFGICYGLLIIPFAAYMRNKPIAEKLGYIPQAEVLKFIGADQKMFIADSLVMKTLMYYGGLVGSKADTFELPPDYFGIYRTIETALKLDPYNMDAYYFAQAVLVWDIGRVQEANALLEYGMKFRTWDPYLPFYAGFNYAYFLKDSANAARCYKKAGELSGEPLAVNLAGRYLYESGQTDLALTYLKFMEKGARNESIRKTFQIRIAAFEEAKKIETALANFRKDYGVRSVTVEELLEKKYLEKAPVDPYGGHFFVDTNGQVRTTSKFAFAGVKNDEQKRELHERH